MQSTPPRVGARALPHVVIVGGGFGGIQAAKALRKARVRITLVDRSNYHLFQPLLYQVATAGLSPADIAVPIREVFRKQKNLEVLMAEVVGIDPAARSVTLKSFRGGGEGTTRLDYDHLILGLGARHSYFAHPEWEASAPGLKTVADATAIRRRLLVAFEMAEMEPDANKRDELLTFVIVGGGPTGVELAGSVAELAHRTMARDFRNIDPKQARIILVEAGPRVLSAFPESLARSAQAHLEKLGVEIRVGGRVEHVDSEGVILSGARIRASTVVWAAGVVASPIGKWLGAETDRAGRVKVGPDLSVPGYPDIFVIGDSALVLQDGAPLPGVAPVAMQEGRYVGKLLRWRAEGERSSPEPFRYFDKGNLATVGRTYAICDLGWIRLRGWIGWLTWVVVHIYYLIGFRNRLLVLTQWAWAYSTWGRGARLIVESEGGASPQHPASPAGRTESVRAVSS